MRAPFRYTIPAFVLLAACSASDDDSGTPDGLPPDDGSVSDEDTGADGAGTASDGTDTGADGSDTGTGGAGGSIIGVETYEPVLRGLIDVVDGEMFESVHTRLLAFVDPLRNDRQATAVDGLTVVREETIELDGGGFNNRHEYACEGGGTLALNALPAGLDYEFGDCEVDGIVRDGKVGAVFAREQETYAYERFGERGLESGDVMLDGTRFDGDYSRSFDMRFEWTVNSFRHGNAGEAITVSDAAFERLVDVTATPPSSRPPPPEEYEQTLSATFTVSAPWSDGESITASTGDTPFGGFGLPGVYTKGALVARAASDDSALVLEADTGEPSSASVTVTEAGVTSGFIVSWSDIGMLPCLTPRGDTAEIHGCRPRP